MDKNKLKEVLKTIVTEESEYKVFFKKALEKAGKSIPQMSDEEKKAFFNKIDAAWDAKGEKNEELTGNQHKLDVDGDGEIEASDLAALRAGKKKNESINEGIGTIALGVAGGLILLKILKFVLKKVVGAVGMNVKLPKEKLLEIVKQTIATALTKTSSSGVNIMDIMTLQSYLKDEINSGRITTIKQIVQVIDKVTKKGKNESVKEGEDIDIGHTDDEPNMLKSTAYEIAQYSSKLVEKLDKYDNMPQEVDFPNWWQAKLILAKDYVQSAHNYLDSKETLGEGRAFINAARKAKTEGKKEFEFNGKTYPVTIKD